jgi:opacity protein-like surface antigen
MRRLTPAILPLLIVLLAFLVPTAAQGAVRTSIGLVGGAGLPVGWWSDRWDPFQSGEVNLRYEFHPNVGVIFISGLGKAYLAEIPANTILEQSRIEIEPDFQDYTTIVKAAQGGSFKQITTGFGIYGERMVSGFRSYGSLAMLVYHWKFERDQELVVEVAPPDVGSKQKYSDNWNDLQDGSDIGLQLAVGVVKAIRPGLLVDLSAAYHLVNIGAKDGALAYWGFPIRTKSPLQQARLDGSKGQVDFIQVRIGVRYGR